MAKVEFVGFVDQWSKNDPQNPSWGMRVTEVHSRKENDQWVNVGRTVRLVKAGYSDGQPVNIDFASFRAGDRVKIVGKEVTKTREYNGETVRDLVVTAEEIERLSSGKATQEAAISQFQQGSFVDDGSAPF